jgi:hypothetical protein
VRDPKARACACAATPDGEIVHAARNRVTDMSGPPGEVFGSSLAHAEINVLARLSAARLSAMDVGDAFGYLWPRLTELSPSHGTRDFPRPIH